MRKRNLYSSVFLAKYCQRTKIQTEPTNSLEKFKGWRILEEIDKQVCQKNKTP